MSLFYRPTAGSALPDSAASQFRVSEGSGTTLNNEYSNQPDASLNFSTWVADSSLEGGYGLDFDGTDDQASINSLYSFIGESSPFSFCVTLEMTDLSTEQVIWSQADGYVFTVGTPMSTSGELGAGYYDGSSWVAGRSASTADTNRLRLGIGIDPTAPKIGVYSDGAAADDTTNRPGGSTQAANTLGTQTNGSRPADMVLDNPVWYDTFLSDSGFSDDYNAQPWS